jgi:hypothetical protein
VVGERGHTLVVLDRDARDRAVGGAVGARVEEGAVGRAEDLELEELGAVEDLVVYDRNLRSPWRG